jgi:Ca2+/Na+ antiporter
VAIIFILFVLGWVGVLYWFLQDRNFFRLGGLLIMSLLTYLSFELTAWSFRPPFWVMLIIGMTPLVLVSYGFRAYDYKRKQEKLKNEEKPKNEEELA